MTDQKYFDVIIIGGSFSGLAAGMALGRALRQVLIIDSGKPCNWQTPNSHNFLTQDGKKSSMKALYTRCPFEQHCTIPEALGCEKTDQGYIKTDFFQKTTVHGIFAVGII